MRVGITDHCCRQYQARVRPGIDLQTVRRELISLIKLAGDPQLELDWKHQSANGGCYLEISDGIALTLQPNGKGWAATTVVIRGAHGDYYRERKQERKRRRRDARRARSHYSGRHNRNVKRLETWGPEWPD